MLVSPELITTKEAAEQMFVAESTIRSWVRKGWLPTAIKVKRKSYYWREDVLKAELRARRGEPVANAS